jgi:RNA polymerase subunit RPABC4/transcription elongation factor Spt4
MESTKWCTACSVVVEDHLQECPICEHDAYIIVVKGKGGKKGGGRKSG